MDALMVYDAFKTFGKVINKGGTILKVHECCIPVNKSMSEISNCYHYLSSNPCDPIKNVIACNKYLLRDLTAKVLRSRIQYHLM